MFKLCAYIALFITLGQVFAAGQQGRKLNKPAFENAISITRQEFRRLERGDLLVKEFEIGGPWPKFQVFAVTTPSPEMAMAIFADFELQKSYIPNLLKAEIVKKKRHYVDVSYELKTPWPLDNSTYINRHYLKKLESREGLQLRWEQIKGNSTDLSEGYVIFEKRFGKTIMIYESHIIPKSMFAGIFAGTARSDLKNALQETIKFINELSEKDTIRANESLERLNGHFRHQL